tara:strand:- start:5015 stop:5845 length:831 start_codon:yes stop_codon:yes gene_type:complete
MDYFELKFDFKEKNKDSFSEIIIAKLSALNFEGFYENNTILHAYISVNSFDKEITESLIKDLSNIIEFDISIDKINHQNWNEEWEKNVEVLHINDKCCIRAEFHDPINCEYEIVITPKMSFGTGHHETTFMMIEKIFDIDLRFKKVLDVGCGTGILSILSKKLEASSVVGIDIDYFSYLNSKENAVLNSTPQIDFKNSDISIIDERFNIILANINRNVILSHIEKYYKILIEDSDLILSGFLDEDVNIIIEESTRIGFNLVSKKNKNKWNLLHFKK